MAPDRMDTAHDARNHMAAAKKIANLKGFLGCRHSSDDWLGTAAAERASRPLWAIAGWSTLAVGKVALPEILANKRRDA
jgi:hypothetical protein